MPRQNKKIFCITEGAIRTLAREEGISPDRLTPEVMQAIKERIWDELRDWDIWIKRSVIPDALENK